MITTKEELELYLNGILARAMNDIELAADKYRREVLVPLCDKKGLSFIAGMGCTVFYDRDGNPFGLASDFPRSMRKKMEGVFEILNLPVLGSNVEVFGYFIESIK